MLCVGLKAELFNRAYSIISSFDSLLKEGRIRLLLLYCIVMTLLQLESLKEFGERLLAKNRGVYALAVLQAVSNDCWLMCRV